MALMRTSTKTFEKGRRARVMGIGLAVPGPVNYDEGQNRLLSALPGWRTVSIQKDLFDRSAKPRCLLEARRRVLRALEWFGTGTAPDYRLRSACGPDRAWALAW